MLFNGPVKGLLLKISREPININNNGVHYEAFEAHQKNKTLRAIILKDPSVFFCRIYNSSAERRLGPLDTWSVSVNGD